MNSKESNYIYHFIRDVKRLNNLELDAYHKSILFCMESLGQKIFPSLNTISQFAGCSTSTAQRKIKDLENHGILEHKRRKDKSNLYTLKRSEIKHNYFEEKSEKKQESEWVE